MTAILKSLADLPAIIQPEPAMDDLSKVVADLLGVMRDITSYADALTAAIARKGDFEIDGLKFQRRKDINIPTDYVHTGTHWMVFELVGTGKTYEVAVTPIKETHGGGTP